jgi:uncharacterized protein (DUF697 family)
MRLDVHSSPVVEEREVHMAEEAQSKTSTADDPAARIEAGDAIIQKNMVWALGLAFVPLPVFDVVAVTGVQVKMLKELSDVYDLPFSADLVRKSVAALASGLGAVVLGAALGGSLVKLVPGIGTTLGVLSIPIVAAAFTRAVGRVFRMHFEAGGTVLNFQPAAMREHFKSEFERAKEIAADLQKKAPAKPGS